MEPAPAAQERIIAHLSYARAVAARSLDPRCRGPERADLIAWGVVGLVQAARRFREDSPAPFAAYAARRVRGQVLDALRQRDPLGRAARRAYREAVAADPAALPPILEVSLDRSVDRGLEPPARSRCRNRTDERWLAVAGEIRRLPRVERRILVLSFGRGYTLREIGARVGLSESGACRARARALRALRQRCGA